MTCCAIIVNYHTERFLPRLVHNLIQDSEISEIVIVDNSHELTGVREFPLSECRVICNASNKGFTAAVNQGVSAGSGEWVLIVNPDVHLEPDCVKHMMQAAVSHQTVLAGPRFYLDDAHIFRIPPANGSCTWLDVADQAAGRHKLDMAMHSFYWILRHERFWNATEPFAEPFLSGACMLVHRGWIASTNGRLFDERFFMYFEDTDLCARVMDAGFSPMCAPDALVVHYYDQAPDIERKKREFMADSRRLFHEKYFGGLPDVSWRSDASFFSSEVEILDPLAHPPEFDAPKEYAADTCYFELGVNPWFVPFAQAVIKDDRFVFPGDVWDRLAPGDYFGRIRNHAMGNWKLWKWKKL